MKQILVIFVVLLGFNLFSTVVSADIDVYEFSTEDKRQRYLDLTKVLRCPKCQNQDIADSNAPIAQDMRSEVHRLVEEGKDHDDVIGFMVERFGEFVSYNPKVIPSTYVLWYGPAALILIGLLIVWRMTSKKRKNDNELVQEAHGLDNQQRAKLNDLLSRYDDSNDDDPKGDKS